MRHLFVIGSGLMPLAWAIAVASAAESAPAPLVADASTPTDGSIVEPDSEAADAGNEPDAPIDAAADAPSDASLDAEPAPLARAPLASTEPSDVGFSFGLRVGYSFPAGRAKDVALSDIVGGAVPIGGEVGYFFSRNLYIGGYFIYGITLNSNSANSTCPSDPSISCDANLLRFGAVAHWHFRPTETIDPWAGLGFGYDIINLSASNSDGTSVESGSLHGFELLNLQAGVDIKPKRYFGVGPYFELSTGHYDSNTSGVFHAWFTMGVRLRTGL